MRHTPVTASVPNFVRQFLGHTQSQTYVGRTVLNRGSASHRTCIMPTENRLCTLQEDRYTWKLYNESWEWSISILHLWMCSQPSRSQACFRNAISLSATPTKLVVGPRYQHLSQLPTEQGFQVPTTGLCETMNKAEYLGIGVRYMLADFEWTLTITLNKKARQKWYDITVIPPKAVQMKVVDGFVRKKRKNEVRKLC